MIRNGLREEEFTPVVPREDARDLLFLGMLRDLKGTDVFLEAIAKLEQRFHRQVTANVIGQAEEPEHYRALARTLGIAGRVAFHEPMPARQAFAGARAIVVPSRAESMPYVVLEAIAAGMPIIATQCRRHSGNIWPGGERTGGARRFRRAGAGDRGHAGTSGPRRGGRRGAP